MVAKIRSIIITLGLCIFATALLCCRTPVRAEASEIDVYTNSEVGTSDDQKSAVIESTVTNSDNTMTSTVDMVESYDESYDLYEESIGNEFFLYSNVGNGKISSNPVSIDIPSNVTATLEKNGKTITYASGNKIKDKGNYVLRVSAVSGATTYVSTFRFSIRDADEKKSNDPVKDSTSDTSVNNDQSADADSQKANDDTDLTDSSITDDSEVTDDSELTEADSASEATSADDSKVGTATEDSLTGVSKYMKYTEVYDDSSGDYANTLLSGDVFRSNVPNGIITNSEVILSIPDSLEYTIYKDDIEYEPTTLQFEEAGSYRIVISSDSLDYILAYGDGTKVTYSFRIIMTAVSDMHIFNTPAKFTLTEVYYEDNEVFAANGMEGSYYKMEEDGNYLFKYSDSKTGVSYSTSVQLDTEPPKVSIGIKNGVANITYNSTDIDRIELQKDNVALTEFSAYKIKEKGAYSLTVTDQAGNDVTAKFQLKNSINSATIWSMIILIGIISGILVIIRMNKKKVIVR